MPMVVYFTVMWTSAFAAIFWLTRWRQEEFGYEMAVVQAFTAGESHVQSHAFFSRTAADTAPRLRLKQLRACHCRRHCCLRRREQSSPGSYHWPVSCRRSLVSLDYCQGTDVTSFSSMKTR